MYKFLLANHEKAINYAYRELFFLGFVIFVFFCTENRMVLRKDGWLVRDPGQRAQWRHAVVERLFGIGFVQVHQELVVEREQLQLVRAQPEENVAERSDRRNLRQLFQAQDFAIIHLFYCGTCYYVYVLSNETISQSQKENNINPIRIKISHLRNHYQNKHHSIH